MRANSRVPNVLQRYVVDGDAGGVGAFDFPHRQNTWGAFGGNRVSNDVPRLAADIEGTNRKLDFLGEFAVWLLSRPMLQHCHALAVVHRSKQEHLGVGIPGSVVLEEPKQHHLKLVIEKGEHAYRVDDFASHMGIYVCRPIRITHG